MRGVSFALCTLHLIVYVLWSCGNGPATAPDPIWSDTSNEYLVGERIHFKKPARLTRSSRYFIERDLPYLAADSSRLAALQRVLEMMEFEDEELDVFVDSTSGNRLIVIATAPRIDFTNQEAAMLKAEMQRTSDELSLLDTSVQRGRIVGKLNGTGDLRMATYAQRFSSAAMGGSWVHTTYFLTGRNFMLVVFEFSDDDGLMEPYLWSVES